MEAGDGRIVRARRPDFVLPDCAFQERQERCTHKIPTALTTLNSNNSWLANMGEEQFTKLYLDGDLQSTSGGQEKENLLSPEMSPQLII